jgi:hypothetical protein
LVISVFPRRPFPKSKKPSVFRSADPILWRCVRHKHQASIVRLIQQGRTFSKKWENLQAALALHFAYYNFCRQHSTLRVTPAMGAGITDHIWGIEELLSA